MNKLFFLCLIFLLVGCDENENQAKAEAKTKADQEALKGGFVPSPVLDFSKYSNPHGSPDKSRQGEKP